MRELTHEAAAEMLAEAALDTLAADDQAAVLAHAATCPDCGPTLAALRDATSELAFSLTSSTDDPVRRARVRTRLLARARADLSVAELTPGAGDAAAPASDAAPRTAPAGAPFPPAAPRVASVRRAPRTPSTVLAWGIAALTGIAAVVVIAVAHARTAADDRQVAVAHSADSLRFAQLMDSIASRDSTLRQLTDKQVSVMQLTGATARAPWGWMFWNHATNRWTLVARNLPAAPAGRTYQLWLVTPRAKVSAGTFAPRPDGSTELQATYAVARDSLRAVAVTEEPTGGAAQPTGAFVMTASAGQ